MTEWISVKDRLPVINETIILTDSFEVYPGFFDSMPEFRLTNQEIYDDVTHWMPLPEPPKEKE